MALDAVFAVFGVTVRDPKGDLVVILGRSTTVVLPAPVFKDVLDIGSDGVILRDVQGDYES